MMNKVFTIGALVVLFIAGITLVGCSSASSARKHTSELNPTETLVGQWCVTELYGTSTNDEDAWISFDFNEQKIHGNAGCNIFNGTMTVDAAKNNAVRFSNLAVTRMMCPNQEREQKVLAAIEEVQRVACYADGTTVLCNAKGKEILKLRKKDTPME